MKTKPIKQQESTSKCKTVPHHVERHRTKWGSGEGGFWNTIMRHMDLPLIHITSLPYYTSASINVFLRFVFGILSSCLYPTIFTHLLFKRNHLFISPRIYRKKQGWSINRWILLNPPIHLPVPTCPSTGVYMYRCFRLSWH